MFQTIVNAVNEVVSLLSIEPLWIKDPTDGRYVIHRDNYGKSFPMIDHLKGSRPQFESSKDEGIVRMHGSQLVGILMNSVSANISLLIYLIFHTQVPVLCIPNHWSNFAG